LVLLLNILLGFIQYQFLNLNLYPLIFSFIYFLVFIQTPLILILVRLRKASAFKDFHKISNWLKVLMLTGILYLFAVVFGVYSISLVFSAFFN